MSTEVGILAVASCTYMWEIDNFSKRIRKHGDTLKSTGFSWPKENSGSCEIFIKYEEKEDRKDNLWIILNLEHINLLVAKLKILNKNKNEAVVNTTLSYEMSKDGCAGFYYFTLLRDFVVNPVNNILDDDKLVIWLEITCNSYDFVQELLRYKAEERRIEKKIGSILPRLQVIDEYETLLNNDKFSDVSLIAEGKTVKAHKCVLAKGSSVFATMFDTDMKEKNGEPVEIDDVKYEVLVELIRFIYAGKVNNIIAIVDELAVAAEKYAVDGLKKMCEKTMIENLSLDNVIGCLQHADRLRMDKLKEEAIEFILENASEVSEKPEFDLLSDDIVRKVFRCMAKRNKQ